MSDEYSKGYGDAAEFYSSLLGQARLEIERLRAALIVARNRVEYLGVACTDPRHFEANGDVFLPKIDAALSNTSGNRNTQQEN